MATHTQKLVLLSLADQANDHGECWPSIETIADRCDLSRQGVMDQLAKLKESGNLVIEPGGGRRPNSYTVVVNATDYKRNAVVVNTVDHYEKPVAVNGVDQEGQSVVVNRVGGSSQPRGGQQSTPDIVVVNGVDPIRKEPPRNHHLTDQPPAVGQSETASKKADQIPEVSEHKKLTSHWCSEFEARFKRKYFFTAPDGVAASRLLNAGFKADDIIAVAKEAWEKLTTGFLHEHSLNLMRFAGKFNEISIAVKEPPRRAFGAPPRKPGGYDVAANKVNGF